jgi:hypothetical protein
MTIGVARTKLLRAFYAGVAGKLGSISTTSPARPHIQGIAPVD